MKPIFACLIVTCALAACQPIPTPTIDLPPARVQVITPTPSPEATPSQTAPPGSPTPQQDTLFP